VTALFYPDKFGDLILSGYNFAMNTFIDPNSLYLAFSGQTRICRGTLEEVRKAVNLAIADKANAHLPTPWIFNARTGDLVDIDLKIPIDIEVQPVDAPVAAAGPGRPRLGVVAREVTLLPRHWEWLKTQPGGASVALRKLVEVARKGSFEADEARLAQAALYRFMSSMAGNLEGFEEASRALFANEKKRFGDLISRWPNDVVAQLTLMAETAFHRVEDKATDV
jgi:uncharacterized protein